MKKLLLVLPFTLALTAQAATQLFICEGKIGTQDITLLDDGHKAGIYKGKVNIAAGARGNNFPKVIFESNELNYDDGAEECKLTATSTAKGSFAVSAPCTGSGAGTITALSLPTIELTAESVQVTCRLEQLGEQERRQPEPRQPEPRQPETRQPELRQPESRQPQPRTERRQPQPQRQCYGSSYAQVCDDGEE